RRAARLGPVPGRRAACGTAGRGLRVRFVVAHPSTYLYFSRERRVAAHVNDWRYGFDRAPGYVDADPRRSLERYLGRDVTIVLGERDNDEASLLLEVSRRRWRRARTGWTAGCATTSTSAPWPARPVSPSGTRRFRLGRGGPNGRQWRARD